MTKKGKYLRRIFIRTFIVLILIAALLPAMLYLSVLTGFTGPLPGKEELGAIHNEEASLVYSADGELIGKFFARNRTNISIETVPKDFINALVATEDRRFFEHRGYDTRSYFRVFIKSILLGNRESGGGSTITQQLVKNLYGRKAHGLMSMPVNKTRELIIARRMESLYSKEEILQLYINSVPFGENLYGVESASRRYFSKPASDLKAEESAILVGMLKANTFYNPVRNPENAMARRNVVIQLMLEEGYLEPTVADSLAKLPMQLDYENLGYEARAGYFVHQVRIRMEELLEEIAQQTGKRYDIEKDGLRIHTSLNMKLQELGIAAIHNHLSKMQPQLDGQLKAQNARKTWEHSQILTRNNGENPAEDNAEKSMSVFDWKGISTYNMTPADSAWHYEKMLNASLLVLNPVDGSVLCWVGGNHYRYLPFDMVLSHRQSASAFKPILYGTAIEEGFSPCTYLENSPIVFPGYEEWTPENADRSASPDSSVALWYALSHSMNLPTLDLYSRMDSLALPRTCEQLQLPELIDNAPSVALGTMDLSLLELTRFYAALADEGRMHEIVMIEKVSDAEGMILYRRKETDPVEIFSQATSETLTAILSQAIDQGTGTRIRNEFGIRSELAGKTGTAQDYSNAWFFTYTPGIVIGTWVGARKPGIHFSDARGSGSSLALPIAGQMLQKIEKDPELSSRYLLSFNLPDEVEEMMNCEPFRAHGLRGFFENLFRIDPLENDTTHVNIREGFRELRESIRQRWKERRNRNRN